MRGMFDRKNENPGRSASYGRYIDGLALGELSNDGSEVRVNYTCYLNATGDLISVTRTPGRTSWHHTDAMLTPVPATQARSKDTLSEINSTRKQSGGLCLLT